ncbi:hypothetical protein CU098_005398 [Rhizopus stolonifer]|uniref:Uncharacterized protein n=1 Tax=Rhizopus stolonifer TaxID=4846 RepID=A0A367J2C2_RHIST|nr:hypothetical protein CU098_005398 [Rhizopus stolonifer]
MLLLKHLLAAGLLLSSLANAQQNQSSDIEYNVIALLNQTLYKSVSVVVDNVSYPLNSNTTFPILFSGKAPLAQSGYHYVKTYTNDDVLAESFMRQPVNTTTPHEFFNRTWNSHNNAQFPQIYSPLESISRIKSNLHRDNEIPTLHIVGNSSQIDLLNRNISSDITVESNLTYLSLQDAFQFEGVELSLSGRSSRWMPKLSYNLKLKKKDGLYGYRRLKLRALYLDPSYLREQVAYDFVKSVGLISSEFSYVRVFMNDQELGLFGLIDTFKSNWLSNVFADGKDSYKNGYLYQGLYTSPASSAQNHTSDLSYYDNSTAYEDGQYKLKKKASGGKKDDFDPLIDFTKFIANAPTNSSDAVEKWNERLDTDSFLRSLALEVLAGYSDGYLTMADNYYLYQNPKNDQFIYISSDMDITLGATMFTMSDIWSGNYSTFPGWGKRPLVKQIMLVPEFKQTFTHLLQNITAQLVNPDVTQPRLNDLVNMIREDVEWDQTLARVGKGVAMDSDSSVVGDAVGTNMPDGLDMNAVMDLASRLQTGVPFDIAVNGPTGHSSLSGLKEWISNIHQNTTQFFSQQ